MDTFEATERRRTMTQAPHTDGDTLVDARSVTKIFGSIRALGPIDLRIGKGEFVTIVGPSGCGKSTMLEIVGGLQTPTEGSVVVGGQPVTGPREHTSIIFQEAATLPWRTVQDNVAFALEVRGVSKKARRQRAQRLLEVVGLSEFANHYPNQLSGGMRQRVAIARALSAKPDLILADEPFGALDEQTRLLMGFELLDLVERIGCGVLLITHSIQEAVLLSDRVLVMGSRPGQVLDEVLIDLPRPRSADVIDQPRASAAINRIWSTIRVEAERAMEARA